MKTIQLRTGAWCGDTDMELQFPDDWEVVNVEGHPPPAMTEQDIRNRLTKPINAPSLIELSKGRKNAVIVIDDIMRPTPTAQILPIIIELLEKGGIARKDIKIVIGSGSHPMIEKEDIIQKVGEKLFHEVTVIAHDDSKNLVSLGHSSRGTPIYVNKAVMESDLKIGIGGIYPHPSAAYSGGAKVIVPGVCGRKTILHLHGNIKSNRWGGDLHNEFRQEVNDIAKTIGLDFIVSIIITPTREIGGVFAGDMVKAHEEGVRAVRDHYTIQMIHDADIVISNAYPFDGSYYFFHRGYWPLTTAKSSASQVLIVNASQGKDRYHFKSFKLSKIDRWRHTWNFFWSVMAVWYNPQLFRARLRKLFFMKWRKFHVLYTGEAKESELVAQYPHSKIFSKWADLLPVLKASHRGKRVKVAVYPYAALEMPHSSHS